MRIYLAGLMTGLSYNDSVAGFISRADRLRWAGFEVLHPFVGKRHLAGAEKLEASYNHPLSTDTAVLQRDLWMVRQADIVFVDLSNWATKSGPSIGCAGELSAAYVLNKHIVLVLDPEDPYHQHPFIRGAATVIYPTVEAAMEYLVALAQGLF